MELVHGREIGEFIRDIKGLKGQIQVVDGNYIVFTPNTYDYVIVKNLTIKSNNAMTVTIKESEYYNTDSMLVVNDDNNIKAGNRTLKNLVIDSYTSEENKYIKKIKEFKTVDNVEVNKIIKASKYAGVNKNSINALIENIVIKDDYIASTDSYRIISVKNDDISRQYSINSKFVKLLKNYKGKKLNLSTYKDENDEKIAINVDNMYIITKKFNFEGNLKKFFMTENDNNFTVDTKGFMNELKFIEKINKDSGSKNRITVIIDFQQKVLTSENANSEINIQHNYTDCTKIAFDCKYLIDLIKDIKDNTITFNSGNSLHPVIVQYDDVKELLCPVNL